MSPLEIGPICLDHPPLPAPHSPDEKSPSPVQKVFWGVITESPITSSSPQKTDPLGIHKSPRPGELFKKEVYTASARLAVGTEQPPNKEESHPEIFYLET